MMFNLKNFEEMKQDGSDPKGLMLECSKNSGEKWNKLTDKEKEPYEELAQKDKKRYHDQLRDLVYKGYFMIDGKKSSELPPKRVKSATSVKSDKSGGQSGDDSKKFTKPTPPITPYNFYKQSVGDTVPAKEC